MRLVAEGSRSEIANPVEDCLRLDATVTMANHTLLVRPDGVEFAIEDSAAPIRDRHGLTVGAVMVFHDVTEKKEAGRQLDLLAYNDSVTGLPNRNLFRIRLEASLDHARREGKQVGLLFLDIDHFKTVNDTLGHAVGDALLRKVGERLRGCVRASDTVARLGGDEFTVVLSGLVGAAGAEQVAKKIVEAIVAPFGVGEHELFVSTSVGIVLYPADGADVDTLTKHADIAMYQAKQLGGGVFRFYDAATNQRSVERLQMQNELRHALDRNEFSIHYQPKQRLADGAITGLEALLRWKSASLGPVGPAKFIPLLEASGLIVGVSQWLLGQVARQFAAWHRAGLGPYRVSVNLSPRQFAQPDLASEILATLAEAGLAPSGLELEITESMLIDEKLALRNLGTIKAGGISIALDDFGTGYSSLSYLRKYAFDVLKIDKAFVGDLDADAGDDTLVTAIVAMARSLRIATVAEGVESERQRDFLRAVGCDEIQGYFLARPMPADVCEAWLRAHEATRSVTA